MKVNVKFVAVMLIVAACGTALFAGPRHDRRHHHHDKGSKGVRLATDIVNLVGAVLNPNPPTTVVVNPAPAPVQTVVVAPPQQTVVVAPPPPPPRTVVVVPPPPPPRTVVVTPPPRHHHRPAPVRVYHAPPHRGHRR